MSRAKRRARTESVVKTRAKKNYHWANRNETWAKFYENVKSGIHSQWVKHTGRICSCYICKRPRYGKRERRDAKNISSDE